MASPPIANGSIPLPWITMAVTSTEHEPFTTGGPHVPFEGAHPTMGAPSNAFKHFSTAGYNPIGISHMTSPAFRSYEPLVPNSTLNLDSNQSTEVPITTFHLFRDLPKEIRHLVWEHALPGARTVHLHIKGYTKRWCEAHVPEEGLEDAHPFGPEPGFEMRSKNIYRKESLKEEPQGPESGEATEQKSDQEVSTDHESQKQLLDGERVNVNEMVTRRHGWQVFGLQKLTSQARADSLKAFEAIVRKTLDTCSEVVHTHDSERATLLGIQTSPLDIYRRMFRKFLSVSSKAIPTPLLHANQESRSLVLKRWQWVFCFKSANIPLQVFFNPAIDTLYLPLVCTRCGTLKIIRSVSHCAAYTAERNRFDKERPEVKSVYLIKDDGHRWGYKDFKRHQPLSWRV